MYGRCPFVTPWWRHRLPSTRITRLHRYYSVIRLPQPRLPSSPLRLVPAYSLTEESRGSPWLPSRHIGWREPASDPGCPYNTRLSRVVGHGLHRCRTPRRDPTVTIFRGSIPSRPGHQPVPLVLAALSVYASTRPSPSVLQNSIRGPWLAATPAGSPACRDDLARSLLHPLVGRHAVHRDPSLIDDRRASFHQRAKTMIGTSSVTTAATTPCM